MFRFRDKSTSSESSNKRYVITNPPSDFNLLPSDHVSSGDGVDGGGDGGDGGDCNSDDHDDDGGDGGDVMVMAIMMMVVTQ